MAPGSRPGDYSHSITYFFVAAMLLGLVVTLFFVVPVLCGLVILLVLRPLLARRDWAILATAGVLGIGLSPRDNALAYVHWLLGFLNVGTIRPGQVPFTVVLCLAVAMAGLAGVILGAPGGPSLRALIRLLRQKRLIQDAINGTWLRRKELVDEPVTPKKARRERLQRAVASRVTVRDIPAVRGPHATERSRRTPLQDKSMPIGLGARGQVVRLGIREMGMHGCVVGSTGSGKTVTLMWIIGAALDMGFDITVIDMKEDTEPGGLRDFLRGCAQAHRLPLQEIALADPRPEYWFNALADMSADEAFDTLISLVEFDDAYWQALNRKILQQVVQLCYQAAALAPSRFSPPTMLELGKIMELGAQMRSALGPRIQVIDAVEGAGYCAREYTNVLRPSADEARSAASFGTRLTALYDSGAGRRILTPGDGRTMMDVRLEGLTYIGLNSLGQPDMARILSSSALQRLSVYAAQRIQGREPKDRPRLIVVDEAARVDRDISMNMLARVRSALFSMILCTQGPTDWIDKNGDDWSRLTQNINWLIAMAQASPEAAEKCAEFLGMRDSIQLNELVANHGRNDFRTMWKEEFVVPTHELRSLGVGEGYLRVNKPSSRTEYMVVPMRTEELRLYEKSSLRAPG